jgi:hypothetical protein
MCLVSAAEMELLRFWLNRILGLFGFGSSKPTAKSLEQPSLFQDDPD